MPPAIIRHLRHADLPDCLRSRNTLRNKNIDLLQLGDDLFRRGGIANSRAVDLNRLTKFARGGNEMA